MPDDTKTILRELRILRTMTAGQVSDMMADFTRQIKNRFSEYDVQPGDEQLVSALPI